MTLATRIAVMRARSYRAVRRARRYCMRSRPPLFVASFVGSPAMNFLPGRLSPGNAPAVQVGSVELPLNFYRVRHTSLTWAGCRGRYSTGACVLARDEPPAAGSQRGKCCSPSRWARITLGWFQFGEHPALGAACSTGGAGISGAFVWRAGGSYLAVRSIQRDAPLIPEGSCLIRSHSLFGRGRRDDAHPSALPAMPSPVTRHPVVQDPDIPADA